MRLDCWDKARRPRLLTSAAMPLESFTWMVADTAKALENETDCKLRVGALRRDNPLVLALLAPQAEDDDLALTEQKAEMSLPERDLFTTGPIGPRRALEQRGTWLKAVFTPATLAELHEAASQPGLQTEVGFFASVRVHLAGDGTCQVVIERLYRSPAEAGKVSMRISGIHVYQMYQRVERLRRVDPHPSDGNGRRGPESHAQRGRHRRGDAGRGPHPRAGGLPDRHVAAGGGGRRSGRLRICE